MAFVVSLSFCRLKASLTGFLLVLFHSRPIRSLTEARGYSTSKHMLAAFGGAGGQSGESSRSISLRKHLILHLRSLRARPQPRHHQSTTASIQLSIECVRNGVIKPRSRSSRTLRDGVQRPKPKNDSLSCREAECQGQGRASATRIP